MPTIFAHAVSAIALACNYKRAERPTRFWILAIVCAILPDVDVIGLKYGNIQYGDLFGHRGFSHSLLFAFIVSLFVVLLAFRLVLAGRNQDPSLLGQAMIPSRQSDKYQNTKSFL